MLASDSVDCEGGSGYDNLLAGEVVSAVIELIVQECSKSERFPLEKSKSTPSHDGKQNFFFAIRR